MSAESDYYEAKRSYNRAVAERQSLRNQESACCSARANATSNIQNAQTNKINFEKRLAEIEKIIKMLDGSGGWFSANVPSSIENANKQLSKADESFKKCMTCTGYPPAELTEVFKTLRVDEDANTSQALDMLKKEKIRLETEIQNLKKSIAENQQIVQNMIKQLASISFAKIANTKTIAFAAYDMQAAKKAMMN